MRTRNLKAIGATCAVLLAMAACGGDDESDGGDSGGGGAGGTPDSITIGVVTSLTGPTAATYGDAAQRGVDARLAAYADEGGACSDVDFEVVVADDASSPAGALSAYQKLIQQDEVYAVLSASAFTFGAAQYLTTQAQDVPVLGDASDQNPVWVQTDNNLFPATPIQNPGAVYETIGKYLDTVGATRIGGAAFGVSESSQNALQAAVDSAAAVGIDEGYVNKDVPFGSSDVGAIVLGIRDSGADALYLPITLDTTLAIATGLRQADIEMAAILAATGYGNDLLQSAPAVEAAQGVSFSIAYAPVELETEATRQLQSALQDQGSATGIPTYTEIAGWNDTDLLLHGLEGAGCDASGAEFISFLQGDATWDSNGLFPQTVDFTTDSVDELCQYFVTLEGEEFVPVEGASPLCGALIE
ncbi:ABC transporter substrate-binding protein [Trujillonella endophytica]|uniref:Amino acid/amide ABC transporter substrate-binding protein, HAAT family (TC 3.A.1.4.-) n=1 Tax=Trujillonella endophytica TaxID=673521 RepID=A0A1H8QQ74_9ACTN|nr:ABC transporter substrate-binding protein [Trujillella endophytica]SEO56127.1 amino acid/amide ABC transporter substrate-binding protein, HAAT family (TC 3.A.1.4.-) [Trujillella endophytica]